MRATFITALIFTFSFSVLAQTPENTSSDVDEVLVIGEQQGPQLWKVYKDDHVLWVMGVLSPLPKKMKWRSVQIESVITNSQEFITPGTFDLHIGFFKQLTLLPSFIGVENNPDGKQLEEILSPELYARWSILKEKYIGKDKGIEKERPVFAATELFEKAIDKTGLGDDKYIWDSVTKIAKKNKLTMTTPSIKKEMKDPKATIKKFKKEPIDDIECFARIIGRLEADLDTMRIRANAWATGDVDVLRESPYDNIEMACAYAILNTSIAEEQGFQDAPQQLKNIWMAAAEKALANNLSTFAVLPISDILNPDGYLAELKARNYKVEGQRF